MKMKERAKELLADHLQKLDSLGKKVVTVKELAELVNESRQKVGYWLKEKGFEKLRRRKKVGKTKIAQYFLTSRALEGLKKPVRMGFYCSHCGWQGYYDLLSDEKYESGGYIVKKNDPKDWKAACHRKCGQRSHRVTYDKNLDPSKLKEKVVFTTGGKDVFPGPGQLEPGNDFFSPW